MNRWIQKFLIIGSIVPYLSLMGSEPTKIEKSDSNPIGFYFGGFGGWVYPSDVTVTQMGTVFFPEGSGGPLSVTATGTAPGNTKGFGGLHIGYEWMKKIVPGFRLAPAIEIEGSYFANTLKNADVINPSDRIDAHEFIDSFPTRIGGLLTNGILEFNNDYISPYFGFGVGVGFVSIHSANSLQIDPLELDVNHFNTDTNDFNSVFMTAAKAGLRYRFFKHFRLSGEYRLYYLTSSTYTFGATTYLTHAPTSPWTVKLGGMFYNAFTLGIDFLF